MGFSEMVEILQQRHKGVIVLCKNGNFYIAVGKDAISLNKKIGLKLTCMGPELCKAGFPVSAFEKYTKLLWNKKCNYMIYDFNNEKEYMKAIIKLYEEDEKIEKQIEINKKAQEKRKKAIIWRNTKKKKTD